MSKRTEARKEDATEQRRNRRANRGNGDKADWGSADPVKLAAAIQQVTKHGFAIRFGYTSEGSAFAIGILGDGEPIKEYVRPTEDIDLYLEGLCEDYAI